MRKRQRASHKQGMMEMRRALKPIFLRVLLLIPNPARSRMMMRARDFKKGARSSRIWG